MRHFLIQVAVFDLLYTLALLATLPFLVYFGTPKPWQRVAEFLLSSPLDNERLGFFSFGSAIVFLAINGLLWGLALVGLYKLVEHLCVS